MNVSRGFELFGQEAPRTAAAFGGLVETLAAESALDEKTRHLAYVAVLAATGRTGGIAFHAGLARQAGATHAELVSAALVGMPAVGLGVLDALPAVSATADAP